MCRILLVEDNTIERAMFLEALSAPGLHTVGAINVEEAERFLCKDIFDVVVADLTLKGRDGLSLLPFVRALYPETAFVMITGKITPDTVRRITSAGVDFFLAKPVDVIALPEQMRWLAHRRRIEVHYKTVAESMPDMMFLMTKKAVFISAMGDAYSSPSILTKAEYIGKDTREVWGETIGKDVADIIAEVSSGGVGMRKVYTIPINTQDRHLEFRFVKAECGRVLIFSRDVTREYSLNNEKNALLSALPDVYWRVNYYGVITFVHIPEPIALLLSTTLGRSVTYQDIVGKNVDELFPDTYPVIMNGINFCLKSKLPCSLPPNSLSSSRFIQESTRIVPFDGGKEVLCVTTDVTALRETEKENLRLNQMLDMIRVKAEHTSNLIKELNENILAISAGLEEDDVCD